MAIQTAKEYASNDGQLWLEVAMHEAPGAVQPIN
jgi:hypothetical protein